MPRTLDIDNPIDVPFTDLTNSAFKCFHEQSPHPSCAHTAARADHSWKLVPDGRSSTPDRNPSYEYSIAAPPQSRRDNESHHPRKKQSVFSVNYSATGRV